MERREIILKERQDGVHISAKTLVKSQFLSEDGYELYSLNKWGDEAYIYLTVPEATKLRDFLNATLPENR